MSAWVSWDVGGVGVVRWECLPDVPGAATDVYGIVIDFCWWLQCRNDIASGWKEGFLGWLQWPWCLNWWRIMVMVPVKSSRDGAYDRLWSLGLAG
jgi:hypothetical protein